MHFPLSYSQDSAYERGRKMCEKLKEEIPRHLFEIPIQAAVGGKIIARETVKCDAQRRAGKMLRWRYFPKEKTSGESRKKERNVCVRSEM